MTHFLFWNLNTTKLLQTVASLVKRHNIDVIILAESGTHHSAMLKALYNTTGAQFAISEPGVKRYSVNLGV